MPPEVYVALMRGPKQGGFESLAGVDLDGTVEAFVMHLAYSWAEDFKPRDVTIFGPWKEKPTRAQATEALANDDASLAPNAPLSSLGDATHDRFFLVQITAPAFAPPAAAAAAAGA
jgi:hypothetical protein